MSPTDQLAADAAEAQCEYRFVPPEEISSSDPEVLRAALMRESLARRRAECGASMQTEVVQLALDLLVREPDIEGFFGGLAKTMVEESDSHTCAVYLINDEAQSCELWLAYVKDRLFTPPKGLPLKCTDPISGKMAFPCEAMAQHLYTHAPGWDKTIVYRREDERLPEVIRTFGAMMDWRFSIATPLRLGDRMLGWMTVCTMRPSEPEEKQWGRVVLIEAIARQAALALHHSRVVDQNRTETRRKAILEERNRLARDIHDNLAQGFAAILMQLQGAQREAAAMAPAVAASVSTAVDLARTHLTEARRSVSALRPNVGNGEDLATALKRVADLNRRTTPVPIELQVDDMPRFGDGVEREIVAIAQEALTNAVRHARAAKITIRAATVDSIGLRLSVTDDGRGIPRDPSSPGFGLTSMQERAERIGASLTIVTAPRNGTEVVLAWDPTMGTQIHGRA